MSVKLTKKDKLLNQVVYMHIYICKESGTLGKSTRTIHNWKQYSKRGSKKILIETKEIGNLRSFV